MSAEKGKRSNLDQLRLCSLRKLGLWIAAILGAMQGVTLIVLLLIAAQRKRRMLAKVDSSLHIDEVGIGENFLQVYAFGQHLYDAMFAAIDSAHHSIYLESFIWKDDKIGREFKTRLEKKAAQGVAIYVIFDGFGNFVVPRAFKKFPRSIHKVEYHAMYRPWHIIDPRHYALDHRKMLVVDGTIGFIGGYNIGSLYATQWRDTHLRIHGPAAADLAASFVDFWNRFCPKNDRIACQYARQFNPMIILRGNDALHLTFPIRDMYIEAIEKAQRSIMLTNAYFVPDRVLLNALKDAAGRGVDVRVLVPWHSNHIVIDWVSHSYYTECLESGIRLFGYNHTMLHAKTATIDGQWSTIGTANLDRLSSIGNYELNVEIYDSELARQMERLFEADMSDAFELKDSHWLKRPWYTKLSEQILTPLRFIS